MRLALDPRVEVVGDDRELEAGPLSRDGLLDQGLNLNGILRDLLNAVLGVLRL